MGKKVKEYEDRIRKMLTERKGKVDAFLEGQIANTAQCWQFLDRICDELEEAPLTTLEYGSQGQAKMVLHPLLPMRDKIGRTLKDNFAALGLSYEATPSKVSETDAPGTKRDTLADFIQQVNGK